MIIGAGEASYDFRQGQEICILSRKSGYCQAFPQPLLQWEEGPLSLGP
jgi:hypothetical protein